MAFQRSSGILLHITSLPGRYGIGDLGAEAYAFADFLADAGQSIWQVLPLVPVGLGHSPYSSPSTFAGNPLLISPDRLVEEELLEPDDLVGIPHHAAAELVDFEAVIPFKYRLLEQAYSRFKSRGRHSLSGAFQAFRDENREWLDDYGLFMALRERFNETSWVEWPLPYVRREAEALIAARSELADRIEAQEFWQFLFARQWYALKRYCNERSIRIFGDLPIYVAHDSADVWGNQDLFSLDEKGRPTVVAGVPPDYFSATGQRWGNPLYRWDVMRERGYGWWAQRLAAVLRQVDIIRLDHFRAFQGYWEIPAHEETAVNGRWMPGPSVDLFNVLRDRLGPLPIVAEDLGLITEDVTWLIRTLDFPGMAVLHFAFDNAAESTYLPHRYRPNLVAYTGTHDNDTTLGWWAGEVAQGHDETVSYARKYLGVTGEEDSAIHWSMIRMLQASVADMVIVPMQDILGLGSDARMNTPGRPENNWAWRFTWDLLTLEQKQHLRMLTEVYGRLPQGQGHR